MAEQSSTRQQFEVSVKDMTLLPAHEAIERGTFPTSVTFHLRPLGNIATACDSKMELETVRLNRALRLQKSGPAVVEVSLDWWLQRTRTWQEDIIDLVL